MFDLLGDILGAVGTKEVKNITKKLGTKNTKTVSSAINLALPVLTGALANNAANKKGASAIAKAALKDHADGFLDKVGRLDDDYLRDGDAILGHVFGDKRGKAESTVSQSSGLDSQTTQKLFSMLSPLVMGYLGKQLADKKLNTGDLAKTLENTISQHTKKSSGFQKILTSFLDKDKDGQIADDVLDLLRGQLSR